MTTNSGFWENAAGSVSTYSLLSGTSPNRYHLMRLLRKKGMRETGEIIFTALAENTPSDTASVTISQVTAVAGQQGGVRTVAAQELMGATLDSTLTETAQTARAATAADVTTLNSEVIPGRNRSLRAPDDNSNAILYVTDLSGNGGGGKGETQV